jgi:hypothetical protein
LLGFFEVAQDGCGQPCDALVGVNQGGISAERVQKRCRLELEREIDVFAKRTGLRSVNCRRRWKLDVNSTNSSALWGCIAFGVLKP